MSQKTIVEEIKLIRDIVAEFSNGNKKKMAIILRMLDFDLHLIDEPDEDIPLPKKDRLKEATLTLCHFSTPFSINPFLIPAKEAITKLCNKRGWDVLEILTNHPITIKLERTKKTKLLKVA